MGDPASILVICSAIAVLVVFALHAIILRATSRRRPGLVAKLVGAVVEKVIQATYILIGLAALIAFAIWVFSDHTPALPPQEPWTPKQAFSTLLRYAKPPKRPLGSPSDLADVLLSIQRDAKSLQRVAQTYSMPREYLLEVSMDAWQVRRHRKSRFLSDELLRSAAQDLRVKSLYAEKNPTNPFASVAVIVTTRNEHGEELQNLEVRYCLKGLRHYQGRHLSFDRWSSPTSKLVPPGSYLMWVRRPDYMLWARALNKAGPEKELDVGVNGESELKVDLLAQ